MYKLTEQICYRPLISWNFVVHALWLEKNIAAIYRVDLKLMNDKKLRETYEYIMREAYAKDVSRRARVRSWNGLKQNNKKRTFFLLLFYDWKRKNDNVTYLYKLYDKFCSTFHPQNLVLDCDIDIIKERN